MMIPQVSNNLEQISENT